MTAPTEQIINVDGQDLHVAVRYGQAGATPLLIINGIGASLELLQPFVDALDPDKSGDVIRFDVPGVGGSPLPSRPYRFSGLCRLIAKMLSALDPLAALKTQCMGISHVSTSAWVVRMTGMAFG